MLTIHFKDDRQVDFPGVVKPTPEVVRRLFKTETTPHFLAFTFDGARIAILPLADIRYVAWTPEAG